MKGRLNLFQATMLRWREMHPYNAVHVVRIDARLDATRLATVIDTLLEETGLTGLDLDIRRRRYEYRGGATRSSPAVHHEPEAPLARLQREIERELNTRFQGSGQIDPFRCFAIDTGPWFYLGLAYDHFIAGGDSIIVLLHGVVARYLDPSPTPPAQPYSRYPPTFRRLFLRHLGSAIRGIGGLWELVDSCRHSVRPRYPRGSDPHNAFSYFRLEAADFSRLVSTAKAWTVTINDLLMALLLQELAPLLGERPPARRRHEVAVASIVNLRRDLGLDANTTFGQFLSSMRVSHPMPAGITLRQVAADIAARTARIKKRRLYLQSLIAIAASSAVWRFLSRAERDVYYERNYPVWGGISVLDVDSLWAHAGGGAPCLEYLRAVPTGPLTPMVVAVTTVAGVLHAGISYRTTAFTAENMDRIAAGLITTIRRLSA